MTNRKFQSKKAHVNKEKLNCNYKNYKKISAAKIFWKLMMNPDKIL